MKTVYLDNAATSFPKPDDVLSAMINYQQEIGASPGRSGHGRSIDAGRIVYETRELLSRLFRISDPLQIVLTKNSTEALNIVLKGALKPGDHVITSSMEHNSVMRPLRWLESRGVDLSLIPCSPRGELDPGDIRQFLRHNTKMVILTHASNVTGTIMPIEAIGSLVKEKGDILFCVDAAQTAGVVPIDVQKAAIDLLAFSGHKSLFGPQGTGGLYIRKGLENKVDPLMTGGTGSRSEFEAQPDFMPDKYESGTPNTIGCAGLYAGVSFVLERTVEGVRAVEEKLMARFLSQMADMPGSLKIYGPNDAFKQTAVVSFNIDGISASDAALHFEERYGILCRAGLHCAPSAHHTLGTFPGGAIRFSFGYFNTNQDVDTAVEAVRSLVIR